MKNQFTLYLEENGWKEISYMSFQLLENNSYEIFFDNSNQIELYENNKVKAFTYLVTLEDLKQFLSKYIILSK